MSTVFGVKKEISTQQSNSESRGISRICTYLNLISTERDVYEKDSFSVLPSEPVSPHSVPGRRLGLRREHSAANPSDQVGDERQQCERYQLAILLHRHARLPCNQERQAVHTWQQPRAGTQQRCKDRRGHYAARIR